ncbi:MAG TPA: DUF2742 domain-containing protein [Mycobacterium sp.]|nr:DUF2742 domain-containing protein [Mycobacterium sp.]
MSATESRTVVWVPVHDYATRLATQLGVDLGDRLPYPGTLSWLALPDDSRAKKAAMLLAASQRVLHIEIEQECLADASKAIATSADWPAVAREVRQLAAFREANPWAVRKAAR